MNVIDELKSLDDILLKKILKELEKEKKLIEKGSRRTFYLSKYLNKSNIQFVEILNKNFYKRKELQNIKALKFRSNDKNIEKYQINHRKEKMQRLGEYMTLAYPPLLDDLWDIELEMDFVLKALKS